MEYRNGHAEVRRSRRLVLSFVATVVNYEYCFYWHFYQVRRDLTACSFFQSVPQCKHCCSCSCALVATIVNNEVLLLLYMLPGKPGLQLCKFSVYLSILPLPQLTFC